MRSWLPQNPVSPRPLTASLRQQARWLRLGLPLVASLAAGTVAAEQDPESANARGRVFPLESDVVKKVVSPAEAATMTRKFSALLDRLLQTPALAQPRGFSIRQHLRLDTPPPGMPKHHPVVGKAHVLLQRLDLKNKETVFDKASGTYGGIGEGPAIHIYANDQTAQFTHPIGKDAQGDYYDLPVNPRIVQGFPAFKVGIREVIVIARPDRKPYAFVTKQRYLEGRIAEAREKAQRSGGAPKNGQDAQALRQKEYQKALAERDEAFAAKERSFKDIYPDPAKRQKQLEKYKAQYNERLEKLRRSAESPSGATQEDLEASLPPAQRNLLKLENELAGLSPEERASPACRGGKRSPTSSFTACEDIRASYIVTLNPDYFDKSLPKTALQLLTVSVPARVSRIDKMLEPVVSSAVEQLDLAALQRSLE